MKKISLDKNEELVRFKSKGACIIALKKAGLRVRVSAKKGSFKLEYSNGKYTGFIYPSKLFGKILTANKFVRQGGLGPYKMVKSPKNNWMDIPECLLCSAEQTKYYLVMKN